MHANSDEHTLVKRDVLGSRNACPAVKLAATANASLVLLRACHCAMMSFEYDDLDRRLTLALSARLQQ
jgi:hypothetical protein